MKAFQYRKPESIEAASAALRGGKGKQAISAGGTDLLGTLRDKIHYPDYPESVISLKGIPGLGGVKEDAKGLSIGAMTTLSEIQENKTILKTYPLLAQAARTVASPQLRHMATIGGNLCQEPRCWYYRYPDNKFDCMRKGGALCNAMSGNNKYHSIYGSAKVCDSPCKTECPNGTDIPEYFDKLRSGDIFGAAKILFSVNPIAAVTGRVCPHTCEEGCNRRELEESVSIRDVERFVGDYILNNWKKLAGAPAKDTGKQVAIVGAGPAGLTAAYYLRKAGHGVTILDDNEKPGGMLRYGISEYRLPCAIIDKIAAKLEEMGIQFKQKVKLGKDVKLADLREKYDGVLLGIGAWASTGLGCPGEDAKGVISGIDFLFRAAGKAETGMGKTVAVIGGGNTAMDACRTALRLGAKKVYNFYRRTEVEMPADAEEIHEGAAEGVDFRYLVAPIEIIKDAKGRVCRVKLQKMKLGKPDESGRRRPEPVKGETETVDVDTVIAAIGQGVDPAGLDGVTLNRKSEIVADRKTFATNLDKVFAAGDASVGPGTVIGAIADARAAAAAIDRHLGGAAAEKTYAAAPGETLRFDPDCVYESKRLALKMKPAGERNATEEDVEGASLKQVQKEACRCFNCGCAAVSPSDLAPAVIALGGVLVTTKREIPAGEFFRAGVCSSTALEEGEIVTAVKIPKPAAGSVQFYNKFRYRKSVDFPVIGVAGNVTVSGGKFTAVKLVLSAVSPAPKELTEVEQFLLGKAPSAQLAEEAADIAVKDALPLAENRYKVVITRALVRRAIASSVAGVR